MKTTMKTALFAGLAVIAALAIPAIAADTTPPFGPGYGWHRQMHGQQMTEALKTDDGSFGPMMMYRRGVSQEEFKRLVEEGKVGPGACPVWQSLQTDETTTEKPAQ
jgi:Spy/CpxP family protein refolding chaperone